MTKLIEPIVSAGIRGAMKQAMKEHRSMLIPTADEIEMQGCEHCSKEFPLEEMTRQADGWFCEGCYAEFKKHFDACDHIWEPEIDDMGDEGQYCAKCCGFVCDGNFEALFGKAPPARS
jgi:hypothetical protein